MFRTYKNDELYCILKEVSDIYDDARKNFDFKRIGENNNIPNTIWALMLLTHRLKWLCESILSCIDFYSAAILYRAQLEHIFKYLFIFLSCLNNGDEVATEYVSANHLSGEFLKILRKKMWPDNLSSSGNFSNTKEFKEFKKKADSTTNKFRFDEVAKSIFELISNKKPFNFDKIQELLRNIMERYSKLSSYVHAGPTAVLDLETNSKKIIEIDSKFMTITAYLYNIFLLSQYQSEHQEELKKIYEDIYKTYEEAYVISAKGK
jgi:hypothetical protein